MTSMYVCFRLVYGARVVYGGHGVASLDALAFAIGSHIAARNGYTMFDPQPDTASCQPYIYMVSGSI